ncbi:MAG: cytochrome C biogenesis protein, partial [Gammaproteobacteria bacterium HGW-Gammaproteobacteria-14]
MLWLAIAVLAFLAAVLMGALWRRAAGDLPPMALILVLVTILGAAAAYAIKGMNKEAPRWVSDWQAYNEFARQVIAGEPDPEMAAEVPLASLARVLQRQLHLTPSAEGWYVLALVYSEMEAPRVAVTAARRAVESSGGALEPQLLLARTLIEQEKGKLTDESAELLESIVAEYPQHDGALTLLASAAMQSQDYSRALPAWQQLLVRHGDGEASSLLQGMIDEATQKLAAQNHYRDLTVTVSADSWLTPGGTLFVFLRYPGGSGQPLAAARVLA